MTNFFKIRVNVAIIMLMVVLMSMRVEDLRIIYKHYAKHEQDY